MRVRDDPFDFAQDRFAIVYWVFSINDPLLVR